MGKEEKKFKNIRDEKVRKELWEYINGLDVKIKTHIRMTTLNALSAIPFVVFSFLYTIYMSYYVPFLKVKNIKKIPTAVDIEFLKPIAKFFKGIIGKLPVDEPVLSIVGMVIVCFIIPLILGFVIKAILLKKTKEKYEKEIPEFPTDEIEQFRTIVDKHKDMNTSSYKSQPLFTFLHILPVLVYVVFMCIGRFFSAPEKNQSNGFVVFGAFLVIVILHRLILKMKKSFSVYSEYSGCNSAVSEVKSAMKKDIEYIERQQHDEKFRNKVNSAFISLEAGDFEAAKEELEYISDYYETKSKDRDYENIEVLKNDIDDIQLALKIIKFKSVSEPDTDDIAGIVGEIIKRTKFYNAYYEADELKVSKSVENATVKRLSEEIKAEYEHKIDDEIKADYQKGIQLFDNGEYIKSMAYFKTPAKILYKDSIAAYYLAKLLGENRADDYEEIYENMDFAERCGIESKEIKQLITSYKQKILDCWEEDNINYQQAAYTARQNSEAEKERLRKLAVCRYYNAGICNYKSGSAVIHNCYHGDGTWLMCEYYKNSVY